MLAVFCIPLTKEADGLHINNYMGPLGRVYPPDLLNLLCHWTVSVLVFQFLKLLIL